jgi:hypothetical protein
LRRAMEMGKSRKEKDQQWMQDLAEKYGIEVDTVEGIHNTFKPAFTRGCQKSRRRTEEFFKLYFEGIKEGK